MKFDIGSVRPQPAREFFHIRHWIEFIAISGDVQN
jgi:hypothetical protein